MKVSVMIVMLLVAVIGNNTATLTTTAQSSLSTIETTYIIQATTEAIHTTTASNTISTSATNTKTVSNTANASTKPITVLISNSTLPTGETPTNNTVTTPVVSVSRTTTYGVNSSTSSPLTISDKIPETSTIEVSSKTAEIPEKPLPETTTSKSETTPSCQNGGIYENGICKCSSNFEGKFCETIKDIISVDNSTPAVFNVYLRFPNMEFTGNLANITSVEYKEFESYFKRHMSIVYESVPGFEGVAILSISNGSVIVLHEVIVRLLHTLGGNITKQYEKALEDLQNNLQELSKNCISNPEICIDESFTMAPVKEPISHEELCRQMVEDGFKDFFTPAFESRNPICVSHCDDKSSHFKNCHEGSCQIEKWKGPRCLCPATDKYMYSNPNCTGKILKDALYGGVGAAIGVLVIIICTLIFLLYRAKKSKKDRPVPDPSP